METNTQTGKKTLVFYRAKNGTLLDKLVAWLDGGPHSHVEILDTEFGGYLLTYGAHLGRGSVSRGIYNPEECDFYVVNSDIDLEAFYKKTEGEPYRVWAAMRAKWNWLPDFGGWCCSTWIAAALGLPDFKFFKVSQVCEWAKANKG